MPQQYENPNELLRDPRFQTLSDEAKQGVMGRIFPRFNSLSPEAQGKILLPQSQSAIVPQPIAAQPILPEQTPIFPAGTPLPQEQLTTQAGPPATPPSPLGQVSGSIVEMAEPSLRNLFDLGKEVQSGETSPVSPLTPLRGGMNTLVAGLSPLAPIIELMDNIITNLVAARGPSEAGQFSPGPVSAEESPNPLLREPDPELVASNLANIGNIAGPEENRPTTNFPPADYFINLLASSIPFEAALFTKANQLSKLFKKKGLDTSDADTLVGAFINQADDVAERIPADLLQARRLEEAQRLFPTAPNQMFGAARGLDPAKLAPDSVREGIKRIEQFVDNIDATPPVLEPLRRGVNPAQTVSADRGKVSKFFDPLLRPMSGALVALRKMGPSAHELARKVDAINNLSEIEAGIAVANLRNATRLFSKEEKISLWRSLDLGDTPINAKVRKVSQATREELDTMAGQAFDVGLETSRKDGGSKPFTTREDYFPRYVDRKKVLDRIPELERHLVETKQASQAKVSRVLRAYIDRHSTPRFGHMERGRELDLPPEFYNTDPIEVISTYYYRGYRRLREAEHYGPNDELLEKLLIAIPSEGGDGIYASRLMSRIRGTEIRDPRAGQASVIVRTLQTPLLASAQMINLSQSAATALRTSAMSTARAIIETTLTKRAMSKDFALRAGATLDSTMSEIAMQYGGRLSRMYLKLSGFSWTERLNRTIGAVAGKHHAEWLVSRLVKNPSNKAVRTELRTIGIDPTAVLSNGGKLTDMDYFRAAQEVVNQTQFRARPGDLPLWTSSPAGRVAFQFKQFAFNQTKLVKDRLVKQWITNPEFALRNAVTGTASYKVGGMLFGRGRQEIRKAVAAELSGEQLVFPENPDPELVSVIVSGSKSVGAPLTIDEAKVLASWYQDVTMAGGIGLMADIWDHAAFGDRSAASFFFGPGVELLFVAGDLTQGRTASLKKAAIRRSGIGPFLQGPTQ